MKKVVFAIAFVAVGLVSCKSEKKDKVEAKEAVEVVEVVEEVNAKDVDTATSVLNWKGGKPTGDSHEGTVALKSGSISTANGKLAGGEFVINMAKITCTDIKDAGKNAYFIGHLSNEDFFEVKKYPTSKFVITSVEEKEGKLAVTGNLTIKDTTKSITIPAKLSEANGVVTFKSDKFNVDRADFNVKYGSKRFFDNLKNKMINDLIEFSFEVKTKA